MSRKTKTRRKGGGRRVGSRRPQPSSGRHLRNAAIVIVALAALAIGYALTRPEPPPPKASPETQALLRELQEDYAAGDYAAVRTAAQAHLELHADALGVHYLLALTAEAEGDDEAAADHFAEEVRRSPRHVGSHAGLARARIRLGDRDGALAALERGLDAVPDDPELSLALGSLLARDGDPRAAEPLRAALAEHPAEAAFELGLLARSRDDLAGAEGWFRQTLADDPEHLGAVFNLGQTLTLAGRRAEGERLLLRHAELQEAQDQLEVLERATRQDWSQASNFVDLGRYQLLRGELEAAAASFDEALRRDARSTEALLGLARAALEAGDPVAAERHLARLIDIDPQHGEGLFFLGLALHTQRRYEEARDALGRSRAVRPWGAAELHFLGNAFFQGGQLADAELAYRQALEAEPALADARYKLALLAFERGNMEAALTELSAYLDLERGGARAWVLEGIVLYRLGRSAEADDAFRRALDRIAVTATSREQVNGAIDAFSSLPDSQAALDRLRELRAGS